jgi:hypothetical protein
MLLTGRYLQGMTYEAAAESLGCPVGTVSVRLKRARDRLRSRLTRRGVAVPAAWVAGVTTSVTQAAAVPPALVGLTARAAARFTVGRAAVAGVVPASAVLLAERTVFAMRFRAIGVGLLGGGMVALVAMASVGPKPESRAQDSANRQRNEKVARPWVKALSGGVKVELLGVSSHPSGPGTWWMPDGSPQPDIPYALGGGKVNLEKGWQALEFAVRMSRTFGKDVSYRWQIPSARGTASGTPRDAGNQVVPDVAMIAASQPEDRTTCTVRFGVASGRWRTEVTGGPEGGSAQGRETLNVIFGNAREDRGKTSVTVSHQESGDDLRVVAADRDGKEHAPSRAGELGVKGYRQLEVEYDLPLSQVKEFRVQSRPFEWAGFEDVALKPRHD